MDNFNDITEEEFEPSGEGGTPDNSPGSDTPEKSPGSDTHENTPGSGTSDNSPVSGTHENIPVSGTAEKSTDNVLKRTIIADEFVDESAAFEIPPPPRNILADFIRDHPDFGFYTVSICIAAVLVCAAFIAGQTIRRDSGEVEERYAEMRRTSKEYNDLIAKLADLREKTDALYQERDRRKTEAEALTGYAGRSDAIDSEIAALESERDKLKSDNWAKQAELTELTGTIEEKKKAAIFNLTPGMYTVGEDADIPAGRYSVTGSGKLTVSNETGTVKTNTVLTADGTDIELADKDKISLDTRAKFATAGGSQEGAQ